MLYTKRNPVGIDIPIQQLQKRLYEKLPDAWEINDNKYKSYGRIYRNQKESGLVPEVYLGNNEYSDSFFDDKISVLSFFDVAEERDYQGADVKANVGLIFCLWLNDIKKNIAHRADEEAIKDVVLLCKGPFHGFKLSRIVTGIENVFRGYNIDPVKFRNMQPLLCFKLGFELTYNIQQC